MRVDARRAVVEPRTQGRIEYRTERMYRDADLAQFGTEGWALVSVIPDASDPSMAFFYFQRQA